MSAKKNRKFAWYFVLTIEGLGIICLDGLLLLMFSSYEIESLFPFPHATEITPVDVLQSEALNIAVSVSPIPQATGNSSDEEASTALETVAPLFDVQVLMPPAEVFSPETIDSISPDDILDEVSYYPGDGTITCSETLLDHHSSMGLRQKPLKSTGWAPFRCSSVGGSR